MKRLLNFAFLGLIGCSTIAIVPIILTSCKSKSVHKVKLVKKDYAQYEDGDKTYETNIYSIDFKENIKRIDNDTNGHGHFDEHWGYYNEHYNEYWVESNVLYFENLPDRNTHSSSSWSQHIKITFVDDSIQEFYTYGTTTYYPWDN